MPGALEGIRVIEWALYHAGPTTGGTLADLGAEVIKLEDKRGGDPARLMGKRVPEAGDRSYYFEAWNRGKKSITLDLRQEAAREVVYRLVKQCDVFFTNYRYQAAQRLRLDYPNLSQHNPKLVYAHSSGFGFRGEDAHNPAFDSVGQARAGILFQEVAPEDEPITKGGVGDHMTGMVTAYGVLAALLARERTGVGQLIDTSIMGSVMWLTAPNLVSELFGGQGMPPYNREKPRNPLSNTYRAKDGKWLVLDLLEDAPWQRLCKALGQKDLARDSRFSTQELRNAHAADLVGVLDRLLAQRDRDEWLKAFNEAKVPAAPVLNPLEVGDDPQALANDYVVPWDHPFFGRSRLLGFPVSFGQTPANVCQRAPDLGEHNEEVLRLAGYSSQEIEALKQQGAV